MQQDTSILIRADHLSKKIFYHDSEITILRDVNLTVRASESVAILGISGSGKTTLLTLLGGLDLPTSGHVYIKQHHLNILSEEKRAVIRGKNMGFIFQSFQLLSSLTALENVMLPLEIHYRNSAQTKAKALDWLKKVGLEKRINHYPSQLSGGELQRVAIARAFVIQPDIIFADEITGSLDTYTGKIITDLMFSINQSQHTTLVIVTHDEQLAKQCESCYVLTEGILKPC